MKKLLELIFPVMTWGPKYSLDCFRSDLVAGIVVLFITVPQVIAYAFLAGMPAEAGLYASMMSLAAYAVFGSSRALAVGPTAIIGIMTLEAASSYAIPETIDYTETVVQLCVVTGIVLIVLRLVNFGSVISFLSHAVVTGFITAAAILIISNQFPLMIGLASSPNTSIVGVYNYLLEEAGQFNQAVISVSLIAVVVLVFCKSLRLIGQACSEMMSA